MIARTLAVALSILAASVSSGIALADPPQHPEITVIMHYADLRGMGTET